MGKREVAIDNRIRERIDELGLDVKSVAAECGITAEYLYKVMRGDRTPSQRVQFLLARVLNTPVERLFTPIFSPDRRNGVSRVRKGVLRDVRRS